jgi:hypothetical protein
MAKVYSAPEEIGEPPELDPADLEAYFTATTAWETTLREWAKRNGSGALAGTVVSWPQGDGQACYVVLSERPLALIHVPTGDAWQMPYIERLTLADIRKRAEQHAALARIFGGA